jgi:hypothetical protein
MELDLDPEEGTEETQQLISWYVVIDCFGFVHEQHE